MKATSVKRLAMIALLIITALGGAAQQVVCTGNHVRLRTGPSTSYPYLIWTNTGKTVFINKGQRLTYLGDAGGFYRVSYDGKSVYISKQFAYLQGRTTASPTPGRTTASPVPARSQGSQVVVNGTGVRLRTAPSVNSGIYCQVKNGTRLPYLGRSGNWYKVRYKGRTLYISSDYSYLY